MATSRAVATSIAMYTVPDALTTTTRDTHSSPAHIHKGHLKCHSPLSDLVDGRVLAVGIANTDNRAKLLQNLFISHLALLQPLLLRRHQLVAADDRRAICVTNLRW